MSNDGKNTQNWRKLCEAAAKEHDPERLRELVRQINDALATKIRGGVAEYGEDLQFNDEDSGMWEGRANRLNLQGLRTRFNQIHVPSLRLTSIAYERLLAWKSKADARNPFFCAPFPKSQ